MSDVRRGPRRVPPAGHDVAGPGLQLDLPDAHVRLAARFRSGDVVPYARPVEKHAAVGKFARRRAVRPPPPPPGPSPPAGHDVRWLTFTVSCRCATLVSELQCKCIMMGIIHLHAWTRTHAPLNSIRSLAAVH
jgi:hypothetical protein